MPIKSYSKFGSASFDNILGLGDSNYRNANESDVLNAGLGPVNTNNYKVNTDTGEVVKKSSNNLIGDPNISDNKTTNNTTNSKINVTPAKVKEGMAYFGGIVQKVSNKFNSNRPVYTQYLKFTVNGNILVDTASKDWVTNNLVSFSIDQNGSGQANTFSLDILFYPNERSIAEVHAIEQILLNATKVINSKGELKDEIEYYMDCQFVYGYGDDESLRSPTYTGKVMKYTPSIEGGMLRYNITGYAGLYGAKEIKLSSKQEYVAGKGKENPIAFLQNVFKTEFENSKSENYKAFKLEVSDSIVEEVANGSIQYMGDDYTQLTQKNLFDVIKDICAGLVSSKEADELNKGNKFSPFQKQVFGYYVTSVKDEEYMGKVIIYCMPSASQMSDDPTGALEPDINIDFNWFVPAGTGANHLIKSWKPEFDGTIAIACALKLLKNGDTYETMDETGKVIKVNGMGANRLGINTNDKNNTTINSIQEYSQWSILTQYPYNATLTMQGCPCEVPMTGKIRVRALMGNYSTIHDSSGVYAVLGKKDTMNGSGYVTELKLFKIVKTYNPDSEEGAKNTDENENGIQDNNPSVKPEIYKTVPNYDRDATIDDMESEFGKQHYTEVFIGKDGKKIYKNTFDPFIDVDTTISAGK